MTVKQYHAALKRLELPPTAARTAELLGLSVRQLKRISGGQCPVPQCIALLLAMYLRHGLPDD